jgi:cytochrome bd ubiquinol oxidase subunit II
MRAYFARRAQAAAVIAGGLSLAALAALHRADPAFYRELTGRALPLVIAAAGCGLAILVLLAAGRAGGLRVISAGVAAVIWGWGVAQYPALLPGAGVTLANAGAPKATLDAVVLLFIVAAAVISPPFLLLFFLHNRRLLGPAEPGQPQVSARGARRLPLPRRHREGRGG